jgi:hypothetical protein
MWERIFERPVPVRFRCSLWIIIEGSRFDIFNLLILKNDEMNGVASIPHTLGNPNEIPLCPSTGKAVNRKQVHCWRIRYTY